MFIFGLILALVGWFGLHSMVLTIIGIVLLLLGLVGNGYTHFGTPADRPRRYWF